MFFSPQESIRGRQGKHSDTPLSVIARQCQGIGLRVASVPASHVYVRHLSSFNDVDGVVRLADPEPADGRTVPGGWWPPLMLEPGWVTAHRDLFDVFHVHFGFDAIGPGVLAGVVRELREAGKPLVYTVHDLRNPHHPDPRAHDDQQDVLVSAANELITLTDAAAQTIRRRWGRTCHVLPHPHVLERARIDRARGIQGVFVVGVHAKSIRANMDPLPVVDALVSIVAALPNALLQINVHDEVFDPTNHWFAPETGAALLKYDRHEHVRVRVHPYFTDEQLWDYLSSLNVSVLPYRFGSHSGWIEACFDLGTAAVVPNCGFYHQQNHCGVFKFIEDGFDEDSLRCAIDDVYQDWVLGRPPTRASWSARRAERRGVADAHRRLYQELAS